MGNKKNTKILLITPPYDSISYSIRPEPPLGLVYLGTVLEKDGYTVKILDASSSLPKKNIDGSYYYGIDDSVVENFIKEFNPAIVGLGCLFSAKWKYLIKIAEIIKKINNSIITVTGGIYPSMCPEESLKSSDYLDFGFIGESEYTFLEFVNLVESNNNLIDQNNFNQIKKIDGMIYKENNEVKFNIKQNYINDLDSLPFPNYNLIIGGLKQYDNELTMIGKDYLPVLSSRSCPNRCSFCNMRFTHGDKYRYRSPENIINEIKYLHENYNIRKFHFADDNVSLNRNRFEILLNLMIQEKTKYNLIWASMNGLMINTLDDDIIKLMEKSGCLMAAIAIESADEEIRKNVIKKHIKEEKIYSVVKSLKKHNIFTQAFFIVGFLEENEGVFRKNIQMILKYKFDLVTVSILQLYNGTDLFNDYKNKGLIKNNYSLKDITNELMTSNLEIYSGYSNKVNSWRKKMIYAYVFSLLLHPWDLFKYWKVFFNPRRYINFFKVL